MPHWVTIRRAIAVARWMSFSRTAGDVPEDDLLGDAATHDAGDLVHQLGAADEILVLLSASSWSSRGPCHGR